MAEEFNIILHAVNKSEQLMTLYLLETAKACVQAVVRGEVSAHII